MRFQWGRWIGIELKVWKKINEISSNEQNVNLEYHVSNYKIQLSIYKEKLLLALMGWFGLG